MSAPEAPRAGIAKIEELAAKLPANGFDLSITKVECPCCEGTGKATGYVQYDGGKVTFHDAGDPCDDCGGSGSLYRISGAS